MKKATTIQATTMLTITTIDIKFNSNHLKVLCATDCCNPYGLYETMYSLITIMAQDTPCQPF